MGRGHLIAAWGHPDNPFWLSPAMMQWTYSVSRTQANCKKNAWIPAQVGLSSSVWMACRKGKHCFQFGQELATHNHALHMQYNNLLTTKKVNIKCRKLHIATFLQRYHPNCTIKSSWFLQFSEQPYLQHCNRISNHCPHKSIPTIEKAPLSSSSFNIIMKMKGWKHRKTSEYSE